MSTPYPGHDPQQPEYPTQPAQHPPYPGPSGQPTAPGAYGPPTYGAPPPTGGGGYTPDIRPVTVTIAVWVTIVLSALSVLAGLAGVLGASALVDWMRENPTEAGLSPADMENLDDAELGFVVIGIGLILASLVAIAVAVFVLKRQNWARITLMVLAGITALFGLLGTFAFFFGLLWLLGAVAVIVLLFVGGAGEWFNRSAGHPPPGPPGPYPPGGAAPYQPPYPPGQPPYSQGPYPPR